jgi:hypothetical protein
MFPPCTQSGSSGKSNAPHLFFRVILMICVAAHTHAGLRLGVETGPVVHTDTSGFAVQPTVQYVFENVLQPFCPYLAGTVHYASTSGHAHTQNDLYGLVMAGARLPLPVGDSSFLRKLSFFLEIGPGAGHTSDENTDGNTVGVWNAAAIARGGIMYTLNGFRIRLGGGYLFTGTPDAAKSSGVVSLGILYSPGWKDKNEP